MSISLLQSWTISMTGTSPLTTTPPSNLTPGSLLIIQAAPWGNTTQPNLGASDPTNGTWHIAVEGKFTTSGDQQNASIGYVVNSSSGKPTITLTNPASSGNAFMAGVISEWASTGSWAAGTGSLDVTASNSGATNSAMPTSGTTGTTTGTGQSLVMAIGGSSASSITGTSNGFNTPSGYTALYQHNSASVDEAMEGDYKIISVNGTQSAAWGTSFSVSPACDWAASIAVFKETPGGAQPNGILPHPMLRFV